MEYALASLWSRALNTPLEQIHEGVIPGDESAYDAVRYLAVDVVGMFALLQPKTRW